MKQFKRILAVASAAALTLTMVPTTAFAAPVSSTGDSAIENDNSSEPTYYNVVLPTIADNTYDFNIDRDRLLAQYDTASTYVAGSYVFFNAQNDAATVAASSGLDTLYELQKEVDTGAAALIALLATPGSVENNSSAIDAIINDATKPENFFYVWVPVEDTTGEVEASISGNGEWLQLTGDNLADYFTIVEDGPVNHFITSLTLRTDHKVGKVFDGKVYKSTYTAISNAAAIAAEYITLNGSGEISAIKDGLATSPDTTNFTKVTTASHDNITYTAATRQYVNTSDAVTITNKSNEAVAVSANVSVENADGLTFLDANDFTTPHDTDASIYMAIKQESNFAPITTATGDNAPTKGAAYFVLDKPTDATVMKYQGSTIDAATGSHSYYSLSGINPTYTSVDFSIMATVNNADAADAAWKAYVDALVVSEPGDDTYVKPTITVVYDITPVTEVADPDEGQFQYIDTDKNVYTLASETNFWSTITVPIKTQTLTNDSVHAATIAYGETSGEDETYAVTPETTVTVTPTPVDGYKATGVKYTPAGGQETSATAVGDGTYTFNMPAVATTISVEYEELPVGFQGTSFTFTPGTDLEIPIYIADGEAITRFAYRTSDTNPWNFFTLDTDYTVDSGYTVITIPASSGLVYTASTRGSLTVTLGLVIDNNNASIYTTTLVINAAN